LLEKNGEDVWLNVAAWEERSVVNGPGERFVLWLQGCPFRCPGCFNQAYLPFVKRKVLRAGALAEMIVRVQGIEGVTFSGGEPMAQAEGLFYLSQSLRARGLTVVCYSGYTLPELERMQDPWVARLISTLDVLIDGRYDQGKGANLPLRGSSNQRVHFLTNAYEHLAGQLNQRRSEIEFVIGASGFVSTGILNEYLLKRLEEVLNELGDEKPIPLP
jgi:anaerobic ribonucleoside-triphosphate reductase activating protein